MRLRTRSRRLIIGCFPLETNDENTSKSRRESHDSMMSLERAFESLIQTLGMNRITEETGRKRLLKFKIEHFFNSELNGPLHGPPSEGE